MPALRKLGLSLSQPKKSNTLLLLPLNDFIKGYDDKFINKFRSGKELLKKYDFRARDSGWVKFTER